MPSALTYPGVYVEEIPSGVRTITGVATSITAFVGRARRGPVDRAVIINSFADFEKQFGGLWSGSALGFAVRDFFLNGGSQAVVVRLYRKDPGNAPAAPVDTWITRTTWSSWIASATWRSSRISMRRPGPPGVTGDGRAAVARAARVAGPATPSRPRPAHFWKAITAVWVWAPVQLK